MEKAKGGKCLEDKMRKTKEPKFDLKTIYFKDKTPKEIAKWIRRLTDKKLQLILLPTSETSCDILIRDIHRKISHCTYCNKLYDREDESGFCSQKCHDDYYEEGGEDE